jgi:hypothetical protein
MSDKIKQKIKHRIPIDDSVPTFIRKTYDILEEKKFPDIIDWNSEGTALIIKKPTEFCQKVLPLYFKHNNLTSFIRQLNMYNFHKRRTQDVDHIYCHELFQKGKKHLLKEIKRKNNEHFHCIQKTLDPYETVQTIQDSSSLVHENHLIKKLNRDTLLRIATLERKTKDLSIQNQTLWTQICTQNEREELLKGILIKLMKQFGFTASQLPMLIKNDPTFLMPINKLDKEMFLKEALHKENGHTFQDQPKPSASYLGSGDFLKFNDDISEPLHPSSSMSKLLTFFDSKSSEISRDMAENKIMQEGNQENPPITLKKEDYPFHRNWNTEGEYLKALESADQRFNRVQEHRDNKGSELLGKRPLDLDHHDKNSLDLIGIEPSYYFGDGNLFVKKEISNNAILEEDNLKLGMFKNLKKEEYDSSPTIDLMNFNIS